MSVTGLEAEDGSAVCVISVRGVHDCCVDEPSWKGGLSQSIETTLNFIMSIGVKCEISVCFCILYVPS